MQNDKIRGPSIRLSTVATSTRQTPKTDFGTVMRDGLIKAGDVVQQGLQIAAPFIPGSAIVSAAVAGANIASTVGGTGGAGGAGAGAGFGSASHGLVTGGGGGPGTGAVSGNAAIGTNNVNGALTIPGRAPGLNTALGGGAPTNNQANPAAAQGDAFGQMMNATRSMAEFQASFNLQYLQLQEKLQQDTRQFNLVSNIMKTKHDAAKNALNNVR